MNFIRKNSYVFFILTYVSVLVWLYAGVTQGYNFCLPVKSPWNLFALLAGVSGIVTLMYYVRHERSSSRVLGTVTFLVGITCAIAVLYRFFFAVHMCL